MYYTEKYGVIFVADIKEIERRIACGRCEIIGLGRSNLPLCEFLAKKGATKIIGRDGNANFDKTEELEKLGVTVIVGENYLDGIGGDEPENTLIFRSPGIRPDVSQIKAAVDRPFLTDDLPQLLLYLAGIDSRWNRPRRNILSPSYTPKPRLIDGSTNYDKVVYSTE